MGRTECPGCAVEVEPRAGHCPICGYEFPRRPALRTGVALLLVAALVVPLLLIAWRALSGR
ncbi:MAG: hypothetical protein PVF43_12440 [Candidatus Eiseniibacteriota bacterium]|jgi:hypothetical protein